jgi:uncharacterized protein (DUF1499 family)
MPVAYQNGDTDMTSALPSKWANRLAGGSFNLAVIGLVAAGVGLTLARYDIIPKISGFLGFMGGGAVCVLAILAGFFALILGRGGRGSRQKKAFIGVLLALPLVAFLASRPMAAKGVPAIHDITTDLDNPPMFATLPLRKDNRAGLKSEAEYRALHQKAYGDLKPILVNRPVGEVTEKAASIAKNMGWTISTVDTAKGVIEATEAVSYIRFYDDIVIRITPTEAGGSRVDVRSVSRVGVSDMGVNAKRIRAFTAIMDEKS